MMLVNELYDLLREKGLSARRNQAIRKSLYKVWKTIVRRYKAPKLWVQSIAPAAHDNISRVKVANFRPI